MKTGKKPRFRRNDWEQKM